MPNRRIFPDPGERVHVELPFSEVCMHLRIAGRTLPVEWLGNGMVQVYDGDDRKLSFPITAGEAGFHFNNSVGAWECWGMYAPNPPAECGITECHNPVCDCGSAFCHFHTHELPPPDERARNFTTD